MVNQANVAAIAALVREVNKDAGRYRYGAGDDELAAYLAANGVLVPGVLTDEQCQVVGDNSSGEYGVDERQLRANLVRVARGDSPRTESEWSNLFSSDRADYLAELGYEVDPAVRPEDRVKPEELDAARKRHRRMRGK